MIQMSEQEKILQEIREERTRQDKCWGGPKHDDQHEISNWVVYIRSQLNRMSSESFLPCGSDRKRFVNIAALAVAAIESGDRLVDKKEEW